MLIIGCDYHPRFQEIATLDKATGEVQVIRLEHVGFESLIEPSWASLTPGWLVASPIVADVRSTES